MKYSNEKQNHRVGSKIFGVLIALTLCMAVFLQPAAAQSCLVKHKVEPGDTLSYIAQLYGVDWQVIAEANDLQEPYVLQVDQVLCIPGGKKVTTDTEEESSTEVESGAYGSFAHVYINVVKEKTNRVYNVRVSNADGSNSLTTIGRLKTNDKGNYSGWFQLPSDIIRSKNVTACIKDVLSDELLCTTYRNPYWLYPSIGYYVK
ncbi:LysM peptidoglycan-binding domain-containing protein [Chloroflexota bacterium]